MKELITANWELITVVILLIGYICMPGKSNNRPSESHSRDRYDQTRKLDEQIKNNLKN